MRMLFCCAIALCLFSCDVDQTREAKLPSVDVDVTTKSGQLPSYDVDWAEVKVGTKTETVKIPKVVVVMEEVEVEVPYMDVDMPGDKEERTIQVEAEVRGSSHEVEIVEVYATGKRLYVISKLKNTGTDIKDQVMRVSDRLILNTPDDLEVRHFIIGKKPSGDFNRSFKYINNRGSVADRLKGGKTIYKK